MAISLRLPLSKNREPDPEPEEEWPVISTYTDDQAVEDGFKMEIAYAPKNSKLFELGRVFITPGALDLLRTMGVTPDPLLTRHQRGDWGNLSAEDHAANNAALKHGERLFSSYRFGVSEHKVWIITEWDRSSTTVQLPEEY